MRIKRTSNQHTHQTNKQTNTHIHTFSLPQLYHTHTHTLSTPLHTHTFTTTNQTFIIFVLSNKRKKEFIFTKFLSLSINSISQKILMKNVTKFILIWTTFSPVVLISFAAVIRNRNWPDDLIITFFLFCFPNWQFWILFNSIQIIFL